MKGVATVSPNDTWGRGGRGSTQSKWSYFGVNQNVIFEWNFTTITLKNYAFCKILSRIIWMVPNEIVSKVNNKKCEETLTLLANNFIAAIFSWIRQRILPEFYTLSFIGGSLSLWFCILTILTISTFFSTKNPLKKGTGH